MTERQSIWHDFTVDLCREVFVSFVHTTDDGVERGSDGGPLLGVLQGKGALLVRGIQQEDRA